MLTMFPVAMVVPFPAYFMATLDTKPPDGAVPISLKYPVTVVGAPADGAVKYCRRTSVDVIFTKLFLSPGGKTPTNSLMLVEPGMVPGIDKNVLSAPFG
ncbi:hypothetical protein MT325_m509L [Paramecium bursaria chlorella virus MT325]|uniref:Uncharacterized protein m509L n=1 Tax=Paramecium bursaria Chlorella virus MT325 TaxID=346932 RepID=A7IUN9_PBCVM|nr:hypothetical protein MT325_m509L [Paramecium bursaria chlorella virus MT325]